MGGEISRCQNDGLTCERFQAGLRSLHCGNALCGGDRYRELDPPSRRARLSHAFQLADLQADDQPGKRPCKNRRRYRVGALEDRRLSRSCGVSRRSQGDGRRLRHRISAGAQQSPYRGTRRRHDHQMERKSGDCQPRQTPRPPSPARRATASILCSARSARLTLSPRTPAIRRTGRRTGGSAAQSSSGSTATSLPSPRIARPTVPDRWPARAPSFPAPRR